MDGFTSKQETQNDPMTTRESRAKIMSMELTPAVDILESKEGVTLIIDLPGVSKDTLDIDVDKNILTVKGGINLHTDESLNATYMDVHTGTFTRQFTLGSELDSNAIDASLNNGELELFMPRSEKHKPQKIEVKVG